MLRRLDFRRWLRPQFGLRSLLIFITLAAVAGAVGIVWWQWPYEVESRVDWTEWSGHPVYFMEWYDGGQSGSAPRFRVVQEVYTDLYGDVVQHGKETVWGPDGARLRTMGWRRGEKHGKWIDWDREGAVLAKGEYANGKKTGLWILRDYKERAERKEILYRDGKEQHVTLYAANGRKVADIPFVDGARHGLEQRWSPNGQKILETRYVKGDRHGLDRSWQPDGDLRYEGTWRKGLEHGRWRFFGQPDKIVREAQFRDGRVVFPDGRLSSPIPIQGELAPGAGEKILTAIDEPTQMQFIETPLQYALDFLKDYHQIEMILNRRVLNEAGWRSGSSVTLNVAGVSLRAAMPLLFPEDGTIPSPVTPAGWRNAPLAAAKPQPLAPVIRYDVLAITTRRDRDNWRDRSGVVRLVAESPEPWRSRLLERTHAEFIETPLKDALAFLSEYHGYNRGFRIRLDTTDGPPPDWLATAPVTRNLLGVPLATVLALLCDELDLECRIVEPDLVLRPRTEASEDEGAGSR